MNYPIQSLVYIAPILFIVMMVAFPLIGVFGGWKRAAYWGGGNFLFYIIGMLIWTFAGAAMSQPIIGLIKSIIPQQSDADFSRIAASVLAPVWFVGFLLIANLILLINYYAWFKRVAGLSKYKTVKKQGKDGSVVKTKVLVNHNYSTRYKAMSMVVGGVGMGALMLPTTFAMTNALFFTTTSYRTRANNAFAAAIYNATASTDYSVDWFSYYSNTTDSAADFDALFAALDMQNIQIQFELPDGSKTDDESLIDALADTFDYGLGEINGNTMNYNDDTIDEEDLIDSVNYMIDRWNELMNKAGWAMSALFNSSNATAIVTQMVSQLAGESIDDTLILNENSIKNYVGDEATGDEGIFNKMLKKYENDPKDGTGDFHKIIQVDVNQRSYDNMVDAIANLYEWSDPALKEQYYDDFRDCMYDLMGLMFY